MKYIEHIVYFLGHVLSDKYENEFVSFGFNNYDNLTKDKLQIKEENIHILTELSKDKMSCENIIYNFLNNGCVSVFIEYKIDEFIKDYDKKGAENFTKTSELIMNRLEMLISDKIIINPNMQWGIPNILKTLDTKYYNELRINSSLYTQNFVFENSLEESNYLTDEFTEIKEGSLSVNICWGVRYWTSKEFMIDKLDYEIVYLSKKVTLTTELSIFTILSQKILYNKEFRDKISIEEMELLISSYRTLYQLNDIIALDFSEFAKKFNDLCFLDDKIDDLKSSTNSSEKTLLQLIKYTESKKYDKYNKIVQNILSIIAVLTIYSVLNDVASFLPIEEGKPIQSLRFDILIATTLILFFIGFYLLKIKKK